jgi:hypothetical protein
MGADHTTRMRPVTNDQLPQPFTAPSCQAWQACTDSMWILKFEGDAMTSWLRANAWRNRADRSADRVGNSGD